MAEVPISEAKRRQLFKDAMSGRWRSVVQTYASDPSAREAKITRAEDTVLHVAVSEGDIAVILSLVRSIPGDAALRVLASANEAGDTPLHVAAALGLVDVCHVLADRSPQLVVEARNRNGETPLFVAAHHGKKKAFFALQSKIGSRPELSQLSYCRRRDGNTILHTAINGEHFDLAFEIIYLYPSFVNYNNERGQTALHLLANKPSAFRSGSRIRRLDSLIYSCIIVDALKPKYKPVQLDEYEKQPEENKFKLLENYKSCFRMFIIVEHAFKLLASSFLCPFGKNADNDGDEENLGNSLQKNITQNVAVENQGDDENQTQMETAYKAHTRLPDNYVTCFRFFKIMLKFLLVILGIGVWRVEKLKRKKRRHTHASQLMDELVNRASHWGYEEDGRRPYKTLKEGEISIGIPLKIADDIVNAARTPTSSTSQAKQGETDEPDGDTPILVAAKRGVMEMVKKILTTFPVAVQDLDANHKNVVLLAVEYRQPHVYKYMLQIKKMKESIVGRVDKDGNSALHLAATVGLSRPWLIPGAALQMQWEIKWYKFVKNSMEPGFFQNYNNKGQTAREIFTQKHQSLVKEAGKWLTNTSQSCSVVAALIATVAFASATTVPGGVKQDNGSPTLEGQPAFDVFAIAALVALCFSVTSLVMFLSILTSRQQEMDFENDLPVKLILGLTSLFMSIAAMLISFCAGHFYVIENKLKYAAYPIYAATSLPLSFFALSQFPLYIDLLTATIKHVPERTYKIYSF